MSGRKKVIIIGTAHPLRGGLATFNERLAAEFISMGYETIIYNFTLQYPGFLFPGKTQYSSEPAPEGITIINKINSLNPLNWIQTGFEIKNLRPDLVVIKYWIPFMAPCLGTIARIVRRNRFTRVVSVIDNIIPHEKRPGDRMLSGYFANSVDGFIAMSKSVLRDIEVFNKKKKKRYCPHPLYDNFGLPVAKEIARKLLKLDNADKIILFFGFIRDYKGLDLLLEAIGKSKLKELNIKLLVAGEFYTDAGPYHEIAKRLDLERNVNFSTDFIPDSEVYKYFCACDLVVQPYKSATQSGVTQIAYHFNKPMIVTNVGGLAEIVHDNITGFVVEPDPQEIAEAIIRFYRDNKEEEFSVNASIEKEKYSWAKMVEAIENIAF